MAHLPFILTWILLFNNFEFFTSTWFGTGLYLMLLGTVSLITIIISKIK